jgi:competence protein ComEA
MRLAGLGALLALGALLTMPAHAQTSAPPPKPMATMHTTPPATTMPTSHRRTHTTSAAATTGPVNLNTATADELDTVKYIGKKRAAKIIAGRPWSNPDDLVTKKILPRKLYERVKDRFVTR